MESTDHKKGIILLSGGLDSATVLAHAISKGFSPFALSFDYGQRHKWELKSARMVAEAFEVGEHRIIHLDPGNFSGSALTDDIDVPRRRDFSEDRTDIPITYVPARNTVFLSHALAWAETLSCTDIFIGVNAMDYSGYPDCRPEYITAFEKMANLATRMSTEGGNRLRIHAPLIRMTKAEIIKLGVSLGVRYELTTTCYDPDENGNPCEYCDACLLRLKGFREAGLKDPLNYQKHGI